MPLQRVATSAKLDKSAIIIGIDDKQILLTQTSVTDKTEAEIKLAIATAASISNVELPTVTIHINRDDSIAMATGTLDKQFIWPEDVLPPITPGGIERG